MRELHYKLSDVVDMIVYVSTEEDVKFLEDYFSLVIKTVRHIVEKEAERKLLACVDRAKCGWRV